MFRVFLYLLIISVNSPGVCHSNDPVATLPTLPRSEESAAAYSRSRQRLTEMLKFRGLELGRPIFIRIFKESDELELWMMGGDNQFRLFKTYGICHRSGELGPKLAEGDLQSPEGFYRVHPNQMNPWSNYHLSFNLGYPNTFDRFHNRTGKALMVHGRCSSIGCFAMTDYYMDEIYSLADAALAGGQTYFQVHIFPFRYTPAHLRNHQDSKWLSFWLNLKVGYDLFEENRIPPHVDVRHGAYTFSISADAGSDLTGQAYSGTTERARPHRKTTAAIAD